MDVSEPVQINRGCSTARPEIVAYRLDKVAGRARIAGRWLDCGGCGGEYAGALLDRGAASVVVTDVEPDRIAASRHRWRHESRLDFQVCPAEDLPFEDRSLDGVLMNEVLEHVADERRALSEIARVLRPGGTLALFSLNRWFPLEGHGLRVRGRPIHSPIPLVPWLPKRLTRRIVKARNYWPHELTRLVTGAGLAAGPPGFAFPMMEVYPVLPRGATRLYQNHVEALDRIPVLRRFGVSVLVIAHRPHRGALGA